MEPQHFDILYTQAEVRKNKDCDEAWRKPSPTSVD